jgi:hypothetical protein
VGIAGLPYIAKTVPLANVAGVQEQKKKEKAGNISV